MLLPEEEEAGDAELLHASLKEDTASNGHDNRHYGKEEAGWVKGAHERLVVLGNEREKRGEEEHGKRLTADEKHHTAELSANLAEGIKERTRNTEDDDYTLQRCAVLRPYQLSTGIATE